MESLIEEKLVTRFAWIVKSRDMDRWEFLAGVLQDGTFGEYSGPLESMLKLKSQVKFMCQLPKIGSEFRLICLKECFTVERLNSKDFVPLDLQGEDGPSKLDP